MYKYIFKLAALMLASGSAFAQISYQGVFKPNPHCQTICPKANEWDNDGRWGEFAQKCFSCLTIKNNVRYQQAINQWLDDHPGSIATRSSASTIPMAVAPSATTAVSSSSPSSSGSSLPPPPSASGPFSAPLPPPLSTPTGGASSSPSSSGGSPLPPPPSASGPFGAPLPPPLPTPAGGSSSSPSSSGSSLPPPPPAPGPFSAPLPPPLSTPTGGANSSPSSSVGSPLPPPPPVSGYSSSLSQSSDSVDMTGYDTDSDTSTNPASPQAAQPQPSGPGVANQVPLGAKKPTLQKTWTQNINANKPVKQHLRKGSGDPAASSSNAQPSSSNAYSSDDLLANIRRGSSLNQVDRTVPHPAQQASPSNDDSNSVEEILKRRIGINPESDSESDTNGHDWD